MVNWSSPETVAANGLAFDRFLHTILGVYIWEWAISLDFDWQFITGKKKFRWPLIFYFYGRYAMLFGLIGFIIALDIRHPINCQALYQVLLVLGNSALGVASLNLAIRTMAVWGNNKFIIGGLSILLMGQFAIILRSMTNTKGIYVEGTGCVTASVQAKIFAAMYTVTMVVDFVILVLTAWKTYINYRNQHRSGLVRLLFRDGLAYFAVAFLGNFIAVIFSILALNPVMSLIADVPATTFATMAAGRVVRRLNCYLSPGPEVYSGSLPPTKPSANSLSRPPTGVRVEMTTFTERDTVENTKVNSPSRADVNDLEGQKFGRDSSDELFKPTSGL
ncbi:hypothetical protein V5O48_005208 [Marasmius crinis-equi]|uniref:Transmembrane protein n=1 Tax=Marasmius crinis-equi TaxID=585013 RepID=A0ABR3FMY1_9AGAR